MEYRNAIYNQFGTIDLEINHPEYGWIPFTASPDDTEELGLDLYAEAVSAGDVAPYVPPPAKTPEEIRAAMPTLNPAQIRLALLGMGITEDMVEAKLAGNPAGLIEWRCRPTYRRLHPLVIALAAPAPDGFDLSAEQIDDLWVLAATL